MLYAAEEHLPYTAYSWNEDRARETICDILYRTREGLDPVEGLWLIHPDDVYEGGPSFSTDFYFGAAGVLWAVRELTQFAEIESSLPSIDKVLALHLKREDSNPDSPFCGQLGIRFVKQVLAPSAENSDVLKSLIRRAARNNCREILYGGPGALAMAHLLWRGGDNDYRELCLEVARQLLAQREIDEPSGALVWTQQFGEKRKFIGAAHGSAGNLGVLIRALIDLGEMSSVHELIRDAEKFLCTHALIDGALANWPMIAQATESSSEMLVQWCHGSTGIVTDLSGCIPLTMSPVMDDLFSKAANLVWKAGPLEKGSSLCHGTAGSGLACLKMFERSRNEMWLEQARGLAMFAVEQYQRALTKFGRARFSLWTGDLGLAVFLRDILNERGTLPGLAS